MQSIDYLLAKSIFITDSEQVRLTVTFFYMWHVLSVLYGLTQRPTSLRCVCVGLSSDVQIIVTDVLGVCRSGGFTVRGSFGTAFAKSLWPPFVCNPK